MGDKTKIDWCDASWNPVTGCLHGCEYCYARGIARRFGAHGENIVDVVGDSIKINAYIEKDDDGIMHPCTELQHHLSVVSTMRHGAAIRPTPYPYDFDPTFHRYLLDEPQYWKKQRTIFVCSMADLFGEWVPEEWITAVFDACLAAPQHRYLFLTKNPERYRRLQKAGLMPKTVECWWGASTPHKADKYNIGEHSFVSIEPILEDFTMATQIHAHWVIIGAETGNRRNKVVPKRDWIMPFVELCDQQGTPVFMKESLREIVGDIDFRQELPW